MMVKALQVRIHNGFSTEFLMAVSLDQVDTLAIATN